MSKVNISRFDVSEHLDTEEVIAAYLNAALEEGDPGLLMAAIADVAKTRGIAKVAADAGVGRESLRETLAPDSKNSNPCSIGAVSFRTPLISP